mgnify:FL=1
MSGMPVVSSAAPKLQITAENGSGTPISSVTLAAAKSGDNPGTMDATPTEAEVVALQETLYFDEADNVREVDLMLAISSAAVSAVQCVLAVINGMDAYADAQELAAHRANVVLPNIPTRIISNVAITRITFVGVLSSVPSGVYTGNRLFIAGRA